MPVISKIYTNLFNLRNGLEEAFVQMIS